MSTPAGAQFDDYRVLMPEGAGQVGIASATEALEDKSVAFRVWGVLRTGVPDALGSQKVARIELP